MNREQARNEINSRPYLVLNQLTKSKGKQYICPICNSGTNRGLNSDGALTYYDDTNRFLCFACNEREGFGKPGQDVLGALRLLWNCTENEVFERAGIEINAETLINPKNKPVDKRNDSKAINYPLNENNAQRAAQSLTDDTLNLTSYYRECKERLKDPRAASYLQARGISLETAAAYWIGFDPHSDPAQSSHPTPRIILPSTERHYVGRSIDPNTPSNFVKMNNKGGKPGIFNAKALYDSENEDVFVVEGTFDALSIIEVGAAAIALNSTSNAGKLIEMLTNKRTAATLILCFDNDKGGEKCSKVISEGLQRLNISFVKANISGSHKDPNEALMANRKEFERQVTAAITTTTRPDNALAYIDMIMNGDLEAFKESLNRRTGFAILDETAKGLYTGLYVVGAISSLGKTTFCTQLADQLAAAGEEVLFFSLEQSRLEIVSKSIARRTAQADITTAVDSLSIRRGYLPRHVLTAAKEYKEAVSDRLSIIEGNFNCNISFIGDYVRRYIQKTGKKPVVFVDYLQILQPEKDERGRTPSTKETVDTTVTELKRLSRENGLTIFVISSLNRTNYLAPIDFESFKESGGIEYTADVVWGLQLQCMNGGVFENSEKKTIEKRKIVKEAKAANPRKIELVCLKNRYGISSYSCYFDYYPKFDLFVETKKDEADPAGQVAEKLKADKSTAKRL
ncbi:MAG: DnaB-like helicase C-terminal domain-containing protein [Acutalibacteraceae bacterium]|nr:DnaB-like helicase C-terminal domain-containing protein [Acutalibacteraceae bacterium]